MKPFTQIALGLGFIFISVINLILIMRNKRSLKMVLGPGDKEENLKIRGIFVSIAFFILGIVILINL